VVGIVTGGRARRTALRTIGAMKISRLAVCRLPLTSACESVPDALSLT
jgi:hypothetical protein